MKWLPSNLFAGIADWWRELRHQREWIKLDVERAKERERFRCPHNDFLCDKYGCPEDPNWKGDRW